MDPLADGEYAFLAKAVHSFVRNGWFERCKPDFRTAQDQLDWESVRPPGYDIPEEDIPVCYCSVMVYGVRKKLVMPCTAMYILVHVLWGGAFGRFIMDLSQMHVILKPAFRQS